MRTGKNGVTRQRDFDRVQRYGREGVAAGREGGYTCVAGDVGRRETLYTSLGGTGEVERGGIIR